LGRIQKVLKGGEFKLEGIVEYRLKLDLDRNSVGLFGGSRECFQLSKPCQSFI